MKKLFGLCAIFTILLSCQKEFDPQIVERTTNTDSTNTLLIDRIVTTKGNDSLTITFKFDGNRKLIGQTVRGSVANFLWTEDKFIRSSSGIIQKLISKSFQDSLTGIDSLVYNVHYNTATQQYDYIATDPVSSLISADSTYYTYNSNGKIIVCETFTVFTGSPGYQPIAKEIFTYDAFGNATKVEYHNKYLGSVSYLLEGTETIEYDLNKLNYEDLGNDYILLYGGVPSKNMGKKWTTQYNDPAIDDVINYTTTYNNFGRPVTAIATYQSGAALQTIKFYYR